MMCVVYHLVFFKKKSQPLEASTNLIHTFPVSWPRLPLIDTPPHSYFNSQLLQHASLPIPQLQLVAAPLPNNYPPLT